MLRSFILFSLLTINISCNENNQGNFSARTKMDKVIICDTVFTESLNDSIIKADTRNLEFDLMDIHGNRVLNFFENDSIEVFPQTDNIHKDYITKIWSENKNAEVLNVDTTNNKYLIKIKYSASNSINSPVPDSLNYPIQIAFSFGSPRRKMYLTTRKWTIDSTYSDKTSELSGAKLGARGYTLKRK